MVKSYTAMAYAVAALVLATVVAPGADAHGLRGSHGGWHDAHEEHAPFFGEDEASAPEIGGEGSVMDLESEAMVDPDYDPSDVGREEDEEADESEEVGAEDSEEDGSAAAESDLSDASNASEHVNTFDWEALAALERGSSSVKSEVTQSVPAPLPVIPMSSKPAPPPAVVSSATTPPPIGESAAAAKDIASIDSSAIQRDPESYGVATSTPSAVSSTPTPVTIGESAAAAKDIASIDASAIQRDPKSYGVATSTPSSKPLNETPAAAKPMDPAQVTTSLADSPMAAKPTASTSTQAENSPKQRSYDANDDEDELDH